MELLAKAINDFCKKLHIRYGGRGQFLKYWPRPELLQSILKYCKHMITTIFQTIVPFSGLQMHLNFQEVSIM